MKSALFIFWLLAGSLNASETPKFQKLADKVCTLLHPSPKFDYASTFAKSFRQQFKYEELVGLLEEVRQGAGASCQTATYKETIEGWENYQLKTSNDNLIDVSLVGDKDGLISGLNITGVEFPKAVANSWEELRATLKSKPEHYSVTVSTFDGKTRAINGDVKSPLGSEFKLYVLGAVEKSIRQGRLSWDDQFPIQQEWKSLSSGGMGAWDNGKQVSVFDYAKYMIFTSDNTAADHLARFLGREAIEAMLPVMGNDFVNDNIPFLLTSEMFKLKWALPVSQTQEYLKANQVEKLRLLNEVLPKVPLSQIGKNENAGDKPVYVNQIEWFASTNSVCKAMEWLKNSGDSRVLEILSMNTPFIRKEKSSYWKYAGFKGGSESGVFAMTYLLKSQNNKWGCVSVAINSENVINEWAASDIVKKILKLTEGDF